MDVRDLARVRRPDLNTTGCVYVHVCYIRLSLTFLLERGDSAAALTGFYSNSNHWFVCFCRGYLNIFFAY